MNILIITIGSRGDVQPYVALGVGLQAAGHRVTIATLASFAAFVGTYGLRFAALTGELLELMQTAAGKAVLAGKGNILALLRHIRPMHRRMLDEQWAAAQDADLIIYHPKALGGYSIAERRGIPALLALPLPLYSPTAVFPSPLVPWANLGRMLNRWSHGAMISLASASVRGVLNDWRRDVLGLPPTGDEMYLHGQPLVRLYGYSPAVVSTPADWDSASAATGYWFLEQAEQYQAPEALQSFLRLGPPPVYVGFGSMPTEDAQRVTSIVVAALQRSGQRGVLATGWGGLTSHEPSADIYMLESVPHDWLFPQMAAVVHHGGAGTTAAGLRAGVPTVICPFFGDQPFWGRQVVYLQAGPAPIPQKQLSVDRLAKAITQAVHDPVMRERASALGATIRAEHGVTNAVALIEQHMERSQRLNR